MNKINFKGINHETVTGVLLLFIALINSVLQMLGFDTIPIDNKEISAVVSGLFLIITALWNTWKNRNFTEASQQTQHITDAIKDGKILIEDVYSIIAEID